MPVYEYQCRACTGRFERKQSFADEPIRVCPTCGGETRRVFQVPGIVFKGSGWYVTDSRSTSTSADSSSKAGASANGTDASSAPGTGGESSKSSDGAAPSTPSSSSGEATSS